MLKKRDDHGFHVGIFEQADAASTHIKVACPGIHAESEVRIVPAADYGTLCETVGYGGLVRDRLSAWLTMRSLKAKREFRVFFCKQRLQPSLTC